MQVLTKNEKKKDNFFVVVVLPIFNGVIMDGHPIFLIVYTGYSGIHHSKYWMPIHYDTIKDAQNKKSHQKIHNKNESLDFHVI